MCGLHENWRFLYNPSDDDLDIDGYHQIIYSGEFQNLESSMKSGYSVYKSASERESQVRDQHLNYKKTSNQESAYIIEAKTRVSFQQLQNQNHFDEEIFPVTISTYFKTGEVKFVYWNYDSEYDDAYDPEFDH